MRVAPEIAAAACGTHVGLGEPRIAFVVHDVKGVALGFVHLPFLPVRGMAGLAALGPPGLVGEGDLFGVKTMSGLRHMRSAWRRSR